MGFSGRRQKPDFHYFYQSSKRREECLSEWLRGLENKARERRQARQERQAFVTTLKVDDVLVACWGYEQTNVDWYPVVSMSATGKTVEARGSKPFDALVPF
ncbi:MAG: hypothetical protein Tsb002_00450 [Wenzhouxiangellaceae bacterium]